MADLSYFEDAARRVESWPQWKKDCIQSNVLAHAKERVEEQEKLAYIKKLKEREKKEKEMVGKYRFTTNGTNVEILSIDKGLLAVIKESEVPEFIRGLQEIEKKASTCNEGHKYCDEHHTNWG